MRTVWKFPLAITDSLQTIDMPIGSLIVKAGSQGGQITLWAEVNTEADLRPRVFRVHGTGHEIDHGVDYIGTVPIQSFVWHVYEFTS